MEGHTQEFGAIGWAVKMMLDGHQMKRQAWNPMGPEWVAYVPKGAVAIPHKFTVGNETGPFLVIKRRNKPITTWTITADDLLATDWKIESSPVSAEMSKQTSLQPTET